MLLTTRLLWLPVVLPELVGQGVFLEALMARFPDS